MHNIGYNKVSLTRESSTFPHTIASIDGQVVGGFVRKWRNWNDANPAYSTTTASIDNYDFTANYAKQVNAILGANVTGCKIKINGTENSLPLQNTYFYDDILYQFEAFSQTVDYVNYQFDHWDYNGTYTTQNPLQINKPSSNLNLTVYYKGKPLFYEVPTSLRGLSVTQEINNPLNLSWNEHPSTKVTNYKIYRKVKNTLSWVNPVCLATVPRGTTSYDDLEYFYLSNSYTVILYDVRAYCQEFNTVSDSIFQGPYFGTLSKSSNYTSFQDGTIPENSLGNYPNPFNPSTKVLFSIKENAFVVLQIYDILGSKVSDLVNEFLIAGRYSINFNANNLPSGIYICSIKANNYFSTRKMLLVK